MEVLEDSANDNFGQRCAQLDERSPYATAWDSHRRIPPSINIVSTEQNIQRPQQQRNRIDSIELLRLASEGLSEIGLAVQYQIFVFADVSEACRIADMNSVGVSRRQIVFEYACRFKSLDGGYNDYVSVCDSLSGRGVLSFSFSCFVPRNEGLSNALHGFRETLDLVMDSSKLMNVNWKPS
jgi:hypothetical protein